MFQRMVVVFVFALAALLADSLLAQCHRGGSQGGGFGGGSQGGGFQGGGLQSPIVIQNGYNPMAMQQAMQMQQMWLQQKYVEAVIETQQRQRRLALRTERVARQREEEAQQRAENRARIAGLTGRTVSNRALASDR